MELGNSEAIKHAVRHGIGISCLSRRVVAEQLASGALVELPVPLPPLRRTLYLIRHRQSTFPTPCSVFSAIARCNRQRVTSSAAAQAEESIKTCARSH